MRRGRRLLLITGLLPAFLSPATPAAASTVSVVGQELHIVAGTGEANEIDILRNRMNYVITDTAGITPGAGCSGGQGVITCPDPLNELTRIVVQTGDLDDQVSLETGTPSFIDTGAGNDRVAADLGQDLLVGGPGKDTLQGEEGDDVLQGGPGADRLDGGAGPDRLRGEVGRDHLRAEDGERDLVGGGPGRDRAHVDRGDVVRSVERIVD